MENIIEEIMSRHDVTCNNGTYTVKRKNHKDTIITKKRCRYFTPDINGKDIEVYENWLISEFL